MRGIRERRLNRLAVCSRQKRERPVAADADQVRT